MLDFAHLLRTELDRIATKLFVYPLDDKKNQW